MYAVLDIETTDLNPAASRRVSEIAIIQIDRQGRIEREWCGRDPGFDRLADQVAGQVAKLLVGRLIVAHEPALDLPRLRREFNRLGVDVPLRPELGLSTMALTAQYIALTGRSSRPFSLAVDVKARAEHSALADARTAAAVLTSYLSVAPDPVPWTVLLDEVARLHWPSLPVGSAVRP